MNTSPYLGRTYKPYKIPDYAYIIEKSNDMWHFKAGTRYPVCWQLGQDKLYASLDTNSTNQVQFSNIGMEGGLYRTFINSNSVDHRDNDHEAIAYVYCKSTQELLIITLSGDEARFGGIVIQPLRICRHEYLMKKWKRLTPLIGRWAIFLKLLNDEIIYRPGNYGAIQAQNHFNTCI